MVYVWIISSFVTGCCITFSIMGLITQRRYIRLVTTKIHLANGVKVCREFMDYCYPKGRWRGNKNMVDLHDAVQPIRRFVAITIDHNLENEENN